MRRAVIFLHGNKPSKDSVRQHVKKTDTIICADGGANWAVALGLKPNAYIGDLDSISPSLTRRLQREKIEWLTYPREKDATDSELAVAYARKKGFKEILIFGLFGTRLDHMMANLAMLAEQAGELAIKVIIGKQEVYFVNYQLELSGKVGEYLSLIPIKGDVKGVTTKGLKWQLFNDTLYFVKTLGISNEFIKRKVEIQIDNGILMVIHTRS